MEEALLVHLASEDVADLLGELSSINVVLVEVCKVIHPGSLNDYNQSIGTNQQPVLNVRASNVPLCLHSITMTRFLASSTSGTTNDVPFTSAKSFAHRRAFAASWPAHRSKGQRQLRVYKPGQLSGPD